MNDMVFQKLEKLSNEKKEDIPVDYVLVYIESVYIRIIQHWLETALKTSPQETTKIFMKLLACGTNGVSGLFKELPDLENLF
ncbi:TetR-like C-terminal domain-containing protein [Paenibacillus sp. NFR01]|uniref:TetR-like C-terminal domain-containing protein n=1 Tax=Paenibacillus sp. NFR01 TaxID=1566279 RepID=UPI0034A2B9EA